MSIGRVADARPTPTGTTAEREMRGFLRKIVAHGCEAIAADESSMCFYCGADAEYVPKPNHVTACLYVRAKELLAKYPASHGGSK